MGVWRWFWVMAFCGASGCAHASGSPLTLPCFGADGSPRDGTEIRAIRIEDLALGRPPLRATARNGLCAIALEPGTYWVKAQSPGWRSVPMLVRWPSQDLHRTLVLVPLTGPDLAKTQALRDMAARDRQARSALAQARQQGDAAEMSRLEQAMARIDADNAVQLRRWISDTGFPRASEVGFDGVSDAWLLAQHSPLLADLLPQLRAATQVGELPRSSLALSEDRVRVSAGQAQRYGSQLQRGADGRLTLYPLESPEQVDMWRAEMDLEPLADYLQRFER